MLRIVSNDGIGPRIAAARPVLIVDADPAVRAALAEQLAVGGAFVAHGVDTASEAEAKLLAPDARFDAVILEARLADADGRDLCARLRRHGIKVPIVMLTSLHEEADVVRGLEAGANDYVVKPFRLSELQARLRAQLRSFEDSEDAVFTIGPYTFRPAAKLLFQTGSKRRIRLTDKEAGILKFLYRVNQSVPRQTLLNEVWGYNAGVTTHTLETHIYRLRQKIEANPSSPCMLLTAHGGYMLDPIGNIAKAA